MSIESVISSNQPIPCPPLLLLSPIFPSISVFYNESALHIRWLKYWSFSFSISPSSEYSGLISFRLTFLLLMCIYEVPIHHKDIEKIKTQKMTGWFCWLWKEPLPWAFWVCLHLGEKGEAIGKNTSVWVGVLWRSRLGRVSTLWFWWIPSYNGVDKRMSELLVLVTLLVKENLGRWRCVQIASFLVSFLTKYNLFMAPQGHLNIFWRTCIPFNWDTHAYLTQGWLLCVSDEEQQLLGLICYLGSPNPRLLL